MQLHRKDGHPGAGLGNRGSAAREAAGFEKAELWLPSPPPFSRENRTQQVKQELGTLCRVAEGICVCHSCPSSLLSESILGDALLTVCGEQNCADVWKALRG